MLWVIANFVSEMSARPVLVALILPPRGNEYSSCHVNEPEDNTTRKKETQARPDICVGDAEDDSCQEEVVERGQEGHECRLILFCLAFHFAPVS